MRAQRRQRKRHTFNLSKKSALLVLLGLFILGGGAYAWFSQLPQAVEAVYEPCQIEYGEVVAQWQGDSSEEWDRDDTYYIARSYRAYATTDETYPQNAYEASPTRISTGGEDSCMPEFDETIDPSSDEYGWNGISPHDARIGLPATALVEAPEEIISWGHPQVLDEQTVTGPRSRGDAVPAAWVSDGGSVEILREDEEEAALLWCAHDISCDSITDMRNEQDYPLRGEGYLYRADFCPESAECDDEWLQADLSELISGGEGERLAPFSLRMNAVSTYPPRVGVETVVVYAYSLEPELSFDISWSSNTFTPGEGTRLDIGLRSSGAYLQEGTVDVALEGHPLSSDSSSWTLSSEQIDQLNEGERVSRSIDMTVTESAQPGACSALTSTLAVSVASAQFESSYEATAPYCIEEAVRTYTYSIATRGQVIASLAEFRNQAAETLADRRGWSRAGIAFQQVESGGDFTLWLAAPDQMTSFSTGCSSEYSCRVGRDVIVNDSRWRGATDSWNQAGGSLRDYRHMVVNHEVGHLIGFGHYGCPGAGQYAPVMQQQSIDLAGCRFNPWPLQFEIDAYSSL